MKLLWSNDDDDCKLQENGYGSIYIYIEVITYKLIDAVSSQSNEAD